jgi:hypothetical protein
MSPQSLRSDALRVRAFWLVQVILGFVFLAAVCLKIQELTKLDRLRRFSSETFSCT